MSYRKDHTIFFVLLLIICVLGMTLIACDEDKKPIFHYKIYQEKADGSYILWTMKDKPKFDNGFVYWEQEDGNNIYIGGNITVETFKVGEK